MRNVVTRLKIVAAGVTPPIYKCYEFSWANGSLELQAMQFDSVIGDPSILIDNVSPMNPNTTMPVDLTQSDADIRTGILAAMATAPQLSFNGITITNDGSTTTITFLSFLVNNYFPSIYSVDGGAGAINEITCPPALSVILDSNNLAITDNTNSPINSLP